KPVGRSAARRLRRSRRDDRGSRVGCRGDRPARRRRALNAGSDNIRAAPSGEPLVLGIIASDGARLDERAGRPRSTSPGPTVARGASPAGSAVDRRKLGGRPPPPATVCHLVLIACCSHPPAMVALIIVLVIAVGLCAVGPFAGVDSRVLSDRDRRGWWPGSSRAQQ